MKYKKILIAIIIIGTLILSACSANMSFSKSIADAELLANSAPNLNYKSFIKIKTEPVKIVKERCSKIGNLVFDEVKLLFRFENITDKPLDFDVQVFINSDFSNKFTESGNERIIPNSSPIQLLPGKGFTCETAFTVRNYNSLSESEKLEFDKLKNTYIFEFEIDKKFYSVRANFDELAY